MTACQINEEDTRSTINTFLFQLAARFTTDVVSSCIYGIDSKAFSKEKSMIQEMGASLIDMSFKIIAYFSAVQAFPFILNYYKMSLVPKKVEAFFTNLMRDAIKLRQENKINRDDFLSFLLQLQKKKKLDNIDMAAHTLTFFFDGYETSSVILSVNLYFLGKHESVQKKLRAEIKQSLAKHGSVTFDSIAEMEYLEQIFNGF